MQEVTRDPVVIVDDDASMGVALDRILRLGGYRSRTFASAEALLASDAAGQAGCLLLDIQLDGMSGFELYEQLRAISPVRPVIFMSGVADAAPRCRRRRRRLPRQALLGPLAARRRAPRPGPVARRREPAACTLGQPGLHQG